MSLSDPTFGAFTFSSAGCIVTDIKTGAPQVATRKAVSGGDGGATSQATMSERTISLACDIGGNTISTQDDVRDAYSQVIQATSGEKKDLHIYADRYLWCQRIGDAQLSLVPGTKSYGKFVLDFVADDPYWIANNITVDRSTISSGGFTRTLIPSALCNAPRIPLLFIVTIGSVNFAVGQTIRFANISNSPNEQLRYRAPVTYTSGQQIWFNGETGEILANGLMEYRYFASVFPTINGNVQNTIEYFGPNLGTGTLDIVWRDRFA